jgi:hypothetical protein
MFSQWYGESCSFSLWYCWNLHRKLHLTYLSTSFLKKARDGHVYVCTHAQLCVNTWTWNHTCTQTHNQTKTLYICQCKLSSGKQSHIQAWPAPVCSTVLLNGCERFCTVLNQLEFYKNNRTEERMLSQHVKEQNYKRIPLIWHLITQHSWQFSTLEVPRLGVIDGITSGVYTASVTLLGVIWTLQCPLS